MKSFISLIFLLILCATLVASAQEQKESGEPVNPFLKKYAGTYRMTSDGQAITATTDKYVLTPNGKLTWTLYTSTQADGTVSNKPEVKTGTWKASDGLIQIYIDGFGEGELMSDYRLDNGVFRSESVFLKKEVPKAAPAQKKKTTAVKK